MGGHLVTDGHYSICSFEHFHWFKVEIVACGSKGDLKFITQLEAGGEGMGRVVVNYVELTSFESGK